MPDTPTIAADGSRCPDTGMDCHTVAQSADLREQIDSWKDRCEAMKSRAHELSMGIGAEMKYGADAVRLLLASVVDAGDKI